MQKSINSKKYKFKKVKIQKSKNTKHRMLKLWKYGKLKIKITKYKKLKIEIQWWGGRLFTRSRIPWMTLISALSSPRPSVYMSTRLSGEYLSIVFIFVFVHNHQTIRKVFVNCICICICPSNCQVSTWVFVSFVAPGLKSHFPVISRTIGMHTAIENFFECFLPI